MLKTYFFRPNKTKPAYKNNRPGKDAGYDLYAGENKWFLPFQTRTVLTNSCIHVPGKHSGFVTCRSGHARSAWLTHNGTIDHGYSGVISVTQTNLFPWPRRIKAGTRIAQIIFTPFSAVEMEEIEDQASYEAIVEKLSQSSRKASGFGDSGMT